MEFTKGLVALETRSFAEISLPMNAALDKMTEEARTAFRMNVVKVRELPQIQQPEYADFRERLTLMLDETNQLVPSGGSCFSVEELGYIYSRFKNSPLNLIMRMFITDVFPKFFQGEQTREPGVVCMGYTLDLIKTINPEIATFDDGVHLFLREVRKPGTHLNPFVLGAMVDDTIHLRSKTQTADFLADTLGAERFKMSFLKCADNREKNMFLSGINISFNELHIEAYGTSLN